MVKNDTLLKFLIFYGFFWIFKFIFEVLLLMVFHGFVSMNWYAIIASVIVSYILTLRVHNGTSKSILNKKKLSPGRRWMLYIIAGYAFYITLIKLFEVAFYRNNDYWNDLFLDTPGMIKGFALMALAIVGSFFVTKKLVAQIGFEIETIPETVIQQENKTNSLFRQPNDKRTVHGSASFSNFEEVFNKKYNALSNQELYDQFEKHGGYVISPNFARYIPHSHAVTVAGAGQGKGTTTIIPNLLTVPVDNWIILDVKGENAAITARFQREAGQNVIILDPFDVQRAIGAVHSIAPSGYNPLQVARYLPDDEITDFAAMMAEMFVPESKEQAGSDSFFTDSARNTIKTYILHLITDEGVTERHLGKLYEWLRLNQEDEIKLWVDMEYNEKTKFAVNEFKSTAISAPQTWAGIISNARRATAFLDSPLIQRSLNKNDFDPMELQTGKTTVYVILPERNINTHKTWLRIIFGTVLKLCNFVAKKRVNFLMDEFPILGKMDDFLRAYSFGRGQKISVWIFSQSLSQLKEVYGETGLNTFLANAKIRQFFGVNDFFTQKYVSDLLGETTEIVNANNRGENKGTSTTTSGGLSLVPNTGKGDNQGTSFGSSEQISKRQLLSPEEVGKLTENFVLFVDGDKYLVKKWPYYHPAIYPGRFDPNPYVSI